MTKATFGDGSTTAASNTTFDGTNIDESCPMSGLNNAMRSIVAAAKGVLTAVASSGTDTYTATLAPAPDALATNYLYFCKIASTNTSTTPTINFNSFGAKTVLRIDGSALSAGDLNGFHLFAYDGTNFFVLNPATVATSSIGAASSFTLFNGDLTAAVGSNALTVAIKTTAGADPSAGDPVYVVFRNATLTSGTHTVIKLTAATSVVISSGSTLGTTNSVAFRVWIVGFNDAGTFRLGAINCVGTSGVFPLRDDAVRSSTAEGGLGAADNAQTIYTGTAVTSKAMRILGFMDWNSGLATAGSWSGTPDKIQPFHSGVSLPGTVQQVVNTETGAVATGTTTFPVLADTALQNTGGDQFMSLAITPTNPAGLLLIDVGAFITSSVGSTTIEYALFQDATAAALASEAIVTGASVGSPSKIFFRHRMTAGTTSATTLKFRAGQLTGSAATLTFNGQAGARIFAGTLPSSITVTELSP